MSTSTPPSPITPILPSSPLISPVTIEYAGTQSLTDVNLRPAFGWSIVLAALSGLCVGSCFLIFALETVGGAIHAAVYALTLLVAVRAGMRLMSVRGFVDDRTTLLRMIGDCIAGVGLIIIGAAGPLCQTLQNESWAVGALGMAFALMAAVSFRHLLLYRWLSRMSSQLGARRLARSLLVMGWFKAIYEGIWLVCCATPLFLESAHEMLHLHISDDFAIATAIGAFLGCFGFAAIWIWMLINHTLLYRAVRPANAF